MILSRNTVLCVEIQSRLYFYAIYNVRTVASYIVDCDILLLAHMILSW